MLFEHCSVCRRCCNVDPGYPALEVTLTGLEKKRLGSVCIETRCAHLGDSGCTLGDAKPLSCKLYPLAFNPKKSAFFFDSDCPLMPHYQQQLNEPESDASKHLASMKAAVADLAKTDGAFLTENYKVDSYYFDLLPLRTGNPK
jgi:Fe-S-cluster containining protein